MGYSKNVHRKTLKRIMVLLLLLSILFSHVPSIEVNASPLTEWVRAYQKKIESVKSSNSEINEDGFCPYYAQIRFNLFDMDHDGTPELLETDNEEAFIYTFTGGEVKEIRNFQPYAYFAFRKEDGADGLLYCRQGDEFFSLEKAGEKVTEGQHFPDITWEEYTYLHSYVGDALIQQLPVYEEYGLSLNCVFVDQSADLLETLVFLHMTEDFNSDSEVFLYSEYFDIYPKHPQVIDSSEYYQKQQAQEPDPLGILTYGDSYEYDAFDGEGVDWILKNVYNHSDASIKALKKTETEDEFWKHYYHKGIYYSQLNQEREGAPDAYIKDVTRVGNYFLVTYGEEYYYAYGYRSEPNYETRYAILELKSYEGTKYWSIHFSSKDDLKDVFQTFFSGDGKIEIPADGKYKPYQVVALKSRSNGKYLSCNIGGRGSESDEYSRYNNPDLVFSTTSLDSYEMFYLAPCSDGSYALQSIMNRKYLGRDNDTLKWEYDFIKAEQKMLLQGESGSMRLQFKDSDKWLGVGGNSALTLTDENGAETFELITVSENAYSIHEKMILANGEWFNLDGKGVGYWNIQNEIGKGETHALSMLGYTLMYRNDRPNEKVIEHDNMQCAVGVKKDGDVYDVIITFQGTGGYNGVDNLRDYGSNITSGIKDKWLGTVMNHVHSGYYDMAMKLRDVDIGRRDLSNIFHYGNGQGVYATVNGEKVQLQQLIDMGKDHRARFTILGHSMGGAMAQIYASYLVDCGVRPEDIKGRTFNPALAFTTDGGCDIFKDWYNICVSSDTVPSGLIPGSINKHGIHRLGKTIYLYDNEPDLKTDATLNIAEAKHCMDRKALEILKNCHNGDISYLYSNERIIGEYYTFKENVAVHSQPVEASSTTRTIENRFTKLEITGETYNEYGNRWYQLSDGGNVYWENVIQIIPVKQSLVFQTMTDVYIYSAPSFYSETHGMIPAWEKVSFANGIILRTGGVSWLKFRRYDQDCWIPMDQLCTTQGYVSQRWIIECPVKVNVYDEKNELIASLSPDEEPYSKYPDKIIPYTIGDAKFFDMTEDMNVRVECDAIGDGTMDITILRDYDKERGQFKEKQEFRDITLYEGIAYDSTVKKDEELSKAEPRVSKLPADPEEEDDQINKKKAGVEPAEDSDTTRIILIASISGAVLVILLITLVMIFRSKKRRKQ